MRLDKRAISPVRMASVFRRNVSRLPDADVYWERQNRVHDMALLRGVCLCVCACVCMCVLSSRVVCFSEVFPVFTSTYIRTHAHTG